MAETPQIWQVWVDHLQRWGLQEFAAILLEALGPLTVLGAQIVYLGEPLLKPVLSADHFLGLAGMLENPEETQAFISVLRQPIN